MFTDTEAMAFTDTKKNDQTFTDDWVETRCLQTSKDDVYRHQKNDQTFTDDWSETRCLQTSKDDVYGHQK